MNGLNIVHSTPLVLSCADKLKCGFFPKRVFQRKILKCKSEANDSKRTGNDMANNPNWPVTTSQLGLLTLTLLFTKQGGVEFRTTEDKRNQPERDLKKIRSHKIPMPQLEYHFYDKTRRFSGWNSWGKNTCKRIIVKEAKKKEKKKAKQNSGFQAMNRD